MKYRKSFKGNQKRILKKIFTLLISISLVFSFFFFPKQSIAYKDYSHYVVETGGFIGEQNVINALNQLRTATGWWATYESIGSSIPYYQVYSGGYYGEDNVRKILSQFQAATGFTANYHPLSDPVPYKQIISGGYSGEENVKRILQDFTNSTGFKGTYVQTNVGVPKKRILSGGYVGEDYVKSMLQQFQDATGISASYEPNGQYQEYFQIVSGGYAGEENVKSIMQDFINKTGVPATYVPSAYTDTISILTGGFVGEAFVQSIVNQIKTDLGYNVKYVPASLPNTFNILFDPLSGDSLTKATQYLDARRWWYSKTPTGTKVPLYYNIVSESSLDKNKLNSALQYFKSKGWWAAVNPTGQKEYNVYQIVTEPTIDDSINEKALDYFTSRKLWATTQTTNQMAYPYYNIVSEEILENDKVEKALNFFKSKGWWAGTQETNRKGHVLFGITTDPILGPGNADIALNFYKKNGWYAASTPTGKSEGIFKIVIDGFEGYETAQSVVNFISETFGWGSTPIKTQSGPMITYTSYNLTLDEMINLQMTRSPQTDKYRNEPAYVSLQYINSANEVTADPTLNVRSGPGVEYGIVAKLPKGTKITRIGGATENGWQKIVLTWRDARAEDVAYYLNPNNFPTNSDQYFQFLKLSMPANVNINEVNEKILNDSAGILKGTASAFSQAAQLYGVNELYLIAHALHETGNGTSKLAKGILYNNRLVYNMYGYGAYDSCPETCGAQKAYEEGWFTPEQAIIGGARLIGSGYIYNDTFQQDTLYKMRWNPVQPYHQYATDIGWAAKQVSNLSKYYQLLDEYSLYIDLPSYR